MRQTNYLRFFLKSWCLGPVPFQLGKIVTLVGKCWGLGNNIVAMQYCLKTARFNSFYLKIPNTGFQKITFLWTDIFLFSSPELKAQVSFSDHLWSVVCPSVCPSVNFSHFHLLLQNYWANFNQTWHKASLGKGDSSLLKWRAPRPFPRGDNYEIVKIHWRN